MEENAAFFVALRLTATSTDGNIPRLFQRNTYALHAWRDETQFSFYIQCSKLLLKLFLVYVVYNIKISSNLIRAFDFVVQRRHRSWARGKPNNLNRRRKTAIMKICLQPICTSSSILCDTTPSVFYNGKACSSLFLVQTILFPSSALVP